MGSCPAPARLGSAWLRPSLARLGPALLGSNRLQPVSGPPHWLGPVRSRPARLQPAPIGSARSGTARISGPTPEKENHIIIVNSLMKPIKNSSPRKKKVQKNSHTPSYRVRPGSARPGPAQSGSAQRCLASLGSALPGPVRFGSGRQVSASARLVSVGSGLLARLGSGPSSPRLGSVRLRLRIGQVGLLL